MEGHFLVATTKEVFNQIIISVDIKVQKENFHVFTYNNFPVVNNNPVFTLPFNKCYEGNNFRESYFISAYICVLILLL